MINIFGRSFTEADLTRATVKQTRKVVRRWLLKQGWSVSGSDHTLWTLADFQARLQNTNIAVRCSGTDRPLLNAIAKDLKVEAVQHGIVPICVCGETNIDARILGDLSLDTAVVIRLSDLHDFPARIGGLRPVLHGAIDYIEEPNLVCGWVRVVPSRESPIVRGFLGNNVIGETLADIYRQDLTTMGDGRFGFRLVLQEELDAYRLASELTVKVYHENKMVGVVQPWRGATLKTR